jgi:isochorismate synthase
MSDAPSPDFPSRLDALVASAHTRARESRQPVLVSVVERRDGLDPLGTLAVAERSAPGDPAIARQLEAGRMFWAHPASGQAMAGLGAAVTLAPSGPDRFSIADAAWRALLDTALVAAADPHSPAAGPLLLGGASFEPDGPRTSLWAGFGSVDLFVPAVLVTAEGQRTWMTTSVLVAADGSPSVPLDVLHRLRALALQPSAYRAEDMEAREDAADLDLDDLRPADEWRALVRDAVTQIEAGTFHKVVLARGVQATAPQPLDPLALLDHLRSAHRDSYVFGCWRAHRVFLGASPERLVRLAGRDVDASSLAGSAPRGTTAREDAAFAADLLRSAKDRAEHAIVRSALGEALARFCDDVRSDAAPSLLTLPQVHHLHTAVHARLRSGHTLLELAGALHPTPAVGGTPREPALAFIREHEGLDRGWYAAPVGWIGREAGELAVALRSGLIADDEATLFAGCGIVGESDPDRELAESQVKLRPMLLAIAATLEGDAPLRPVGAGSAETHR